MICEEAWYGRNQGRIMAQDTQEVLKLQIVVSAYSESIFFALYTIQHNTATPYVNIYVLRFHKMNTEIQPCFNQRNLNRAIYRVKLELFLFMKLNYKQSQDYKKVWSLQTCSMEAIAMHNFLYNLKISHMYHT